MPANILHIAFMLAPGSPVFTGVAWGRGYIAYKCYCGTTTVYMYKDYREQN